MASRPKFITTFDPESVIQPFYTGGDVALEREGRILATCLGEEALLTDLGTGQLLARVEGVGHFKPALIINLVGLLIGFCRMEKFLLRFQVCESSASLGGDSYILTKQSVTPSASHLITCSRSLSMKIYDLQRSNQGKDLIKVVLLRTVKPHSTPVITATTDGTSTLLATGGAEGAIKIWDIRGGYVTHIFRGPAGLITALHFFEASMTRNEPKAKKKGSRRDLQEDVVMTNGHGTDVAFRLASGSEDGSIRIWDLVRRKSVASLESHVSVVRGLQFSKEADALVSGSRDKTVTLWNAQTWKAEKVVPILESVEAVGFVEQGALIYTGGESGRLRIWHTQSGREVTEEQEVGNEGDGISQIIPSTTQKFLLSVHTNQSLVLHSAKPLNNSLLSSSPIPPLPILRRLSATHDEIIDMAYVTPDRSLMALATNSEDIQIVSLASSGAQTSASFNPSYFGADVAQLRGHDDIIICISVDWSGCWLATGAKDNTARLWRIDHASNSYKSYATFTGHAESVGAISLTSTSPPINTPEFLRPLDHAPPFLLTGSQDRTIKRWTIPKIASSTPSTTSSSQARALYTRKAHDKDINALAHSPGSRLFASASQDRTIKIWSIEEGEVQGILRGHRRGVWSVAFGPKDIPPITSDSGSTTTSRGLVMTGSGDRTVKIWSLNDYSCLRTFEGHANSVLKVIWLPVPPEKTNDEDPTAKTSKRPPLIASAGGDGLLKIWDASTGEVATTLDNHTDRIWALTANPETGTLVSGGGDGVVTFWKDTSTETAAKTTAAASQRVEQDQELQNYIHRGNYREAITLALALNHPARLLALFQNVVDTSPPEAGSVSGVKAVDEVVSSLNDAQLLSLLFRVRDWNTNARTSPVAQKVLGVIVRNYSAQRLAGLGKRKGGKEAIEALRVYTERHYRRVEELWGESWLVEFLLGEMDQLGVREPQEANGDLETEKDVVMA